MYIIAILQRNIRTMKTTIVIDDELLSRAMKAAKTKTKHETIEAGLQSNNTHGLTGITGRRQDNRGIQPLKEPPRCPSTDTCWQKRMGSGCQNRLSIA